jgi:aminoglycoside phosphotransferase (APT) family kinase protein
MTGTGGATPDAAPGGARRFATAAELAGPVRTGLGSQQRIAAVDRLRGGSKKGVYRLRLDDGSAVICYVWAAGENYWPGGPARAADPADPFSEASGADLFAASHAELVSLGVPVPELILLDRSQSAYPADIALIEDVPGPSLEPRLAGQEPGTRQTMAMLGESLRAMHSHSGPRAGKLTWARSEAAAGQPQQPCEQIVLARALRDLASSAGLDGRLAAVRERLQELLCGLRAAVAPRRRLGLVHGELGPDHVLVRADGTPVLIDIEGLMFFDTEWEHVFLQLRFRDHYGYLADSGLDEARLRLYRLAMHLNLVAGPLQVQPDFPDRAQMLDIAEWNLQRVLRLQRELVP